MTGELNHSDWNHHFNGFNLMRRILKQHPEEINKQNVHQLSGWLQKGVENLRSGIAKVALMTVAEMSETKERLLDSELEGLYTKLLKKSGDSSSFITEEVGRAVYQLSHNCSESKVIALVQQYMTSKTT